MEGRKKEWQKGFPIHFSYFALLVFPLSHFTLEMYVELICKWWCFPSLTPFFSLSLLSSLSHFFLFSFFLQSFHFSLFRDSRNSKTSEDKNKIFYIKRELTHFLILFLPFSLFTFLVNCLFHFNAFFPFLTLSSSPFQRNKYVLNVCITHTKMTKIWGKKTLISMYMCISFFCLPFPTDKYLMCSFNLLSHTFHFLYFPLSLCPSNERTILPTFDHFLQTSYFWGNKKFTFFPTSQGVI